VWYWCRQHPGHRSALLVEDDPAEPREPSDETTAEARLLQRAVDNIRELFRPQSWKAFWRTTVDGLSAPGVARERGISPDAVRVARWRVLHRLRKELGDEA